MRVATRRLADFFTNIDAYPVVGGRVWVNRSENPLDGNRKTAARFSVVFQATAVCEFEDGQFLLDLGIDCGVDYHDASQDMAASEEADRLRQELKDGCTARGIVVMPGMIDMG